MRSKACHIARLPLHHDPRILVDLPDVISVGTGHKCVRVSLAIECDYGGLVGVTGLQIPRPIRGRFYLGVVRRIPEQAPLSYDAVTALLRARTFQTCMRE